MKPEWSRRLGLVLSVGERFNRARSLALSLRCKTWDSGGAQCTADAQPEHRHRFDDGDLLDLDESRNELAGLIARARAQLVLCGLCDAGVLGQCTCPDGDPRAVILDLLRLIDPEVTS